MMVAFNNKSGKTKVLHLISSGFLGGPEKQIMSHYKYYDKSEFEIIVGSYIERGRDNEFLKLLRQANIPTVELRHRYLFDISIIFQLKKILIQNDIDILITHGYKSNIIGFYAQKNLPVQQAMYVRGWTAENIKITLYNRLDLHYLKKADIVITVAGNKVNELVDLGLNKNKIRYIGNAVEIPLQKEKKVLREKFNLDKDTLLIIAAGRLSPEKGHKDLILALKKLDKQKTKFCCIIFGDGFLKQSLINMIDELNLNQKVILAGFDADWKSYLGDINLLINPSLSEVMPNVVLESMSYSCPVIATNVGGVRELIIEGKTGFLAEANSPKSIYEAILKFISQKDSIELITQNAFKHVSENFSFESQANKLNDLYRELRQGKRIKANNN